MDYVAGMSVASVPTMTINTARTITTVAKWQADQIGIDTHTDLPIGSLDYLLLAYCPVVSAMNGEHTLSPGSLGADEKLSGHVAVQCTADDIRNRFFTTDAFRVAAWTENMKSTYGTDFEKIADGGFIWASQCDLTLMGPEATFVGNVFRCTVTLG